MSGNGNEADVPLALSDRLEVGLDDRETSELSLSSRVGLKGHSVESSNDAEIGLELLQKAKGRTKSAKSLEVLELERRDEP